MNVNRRRKNLGAAGRLAMAALAVVGMKFVYPAAAALESEPDVRRDATVQAIEKVMPSVVNIATATMVEYHDFYDQLLRQFYGINRPGRREERINSIGSGVIIDEEGYILSNLHVLRRATRVQVKLWDGREYEADPLVATPGSDVALLKIRAKPGEKFKAVKLAADDDLLLGETVLALGNPFGLGESVSRGILSSKSRREPLGDEPLNIADWLQTDAAINPGNSGGPLINLRGELIGLNVAVYQGQGIGFAIPVKQVASALSQFFTPEIQRMLWFGVKLKPGAFPLTITQIQPGSPAEKAGLRAGWQIFQVNGKSPRSIVEFSQLGGADPAKGVQLQVGNGDNRRTVSVMPVAFDDLIKQKLGLTLLHLTPQTAANIGVRQDAGLYIDEVEKNGPADKGQLQRGFLLVAIDSKATPNLWTVADMLSAKKSGEDAQLSVVALRRQRNGYVLPQQVAVTVRVR